MKRFVIYNIRNL